MYAHLQLMCCLRNRNKPVFPLGKEKWNSCLIFARHTGVLSTFCRGQRSEHTYLLSIIHVISKVSVVRYLRMIINAVMEEFDLTGIVVLHCRFPGQLSRVYPLRVSGYQSS